MRAGTLRERWNVSSTEYRYSRSTSLSSRDTCDVHLGVSSLRTEASEKIRKEAQ